MGHGFKVAAAAAAMLISVPVCASPVMGAEEFYQRAMKLKKKGPLAIFARGEIKKLVAEVKYAGETVKKTRLAIEKTGRHGRYCPPENTTRMGTEEYLKSLGQIPAAERAKIDLIEATTRILEKKFPCPRD